MIPLNTHLFSWYMDGSLYRLPIKNNSMLSDDSSEECMPKVTEVHGQCIRDEFTSGYSKELFVHITYCVTTIFHMYNEWLKL